MSELRPRDPDFERRTRASFARQQFMRTLGARLEVVQPGFIEISMPYAEHLTQQHGYMHGVALAGIADSAAGYAAFTLMAADESPLTVEYKVNMLRPGAGERFVARAQVIKAGRTLSVVGAEVFAQDAEGEETLVQTLLQTMIALAGKGDRVEHQGSGSAGDPDA